jgi:hypothetical protein
MSFTMLTSEGFLTLLFGRSSVFGEAQPWQASCESLQRSWAEILRVKALQLEQAASRP